MLGFIKFLVFLSPFLYLTDRLVYVAFKFHFYTVCWFVVKNFAHLQQPKWVVGIYFFFYAVFILLLSGTLYMTYMKYAGVEKDFVFLGRTSLYDTVVYKKTDPFRKPFEIFAVPPSGGNFFHELYKPFKVLVDPIDGAVRNKKYLESTGIKTPLIIAFFLFYFVVPCLLGLVYEYGKAHQQVYPHLTDLRSLEEYLWYFFKQLGVQKKFVIYYVIIFFSIIAAITAFIVGAVTYDYYFAKKAPQERYVPRERVDTSIAHNISPGQSLEGTVHSSDVQTFMDEIDDLQKRPNRYYFFVKLEKPFDPAIYITLELPGNAPHYARLRELEQSKQTANFLVTKDLRLELAQ